MDYRVIETNWSPIGLTGDLEYPTVRCDELVVSVVVTAGIHGSTRRTTDNSLQSAIDSTLKHFYQRSQSVMKCAKIFRQVLNIIFILSDEKRRTGEQEEGLGGMALTDETIGQRRGKLWLTNDTLKKL